MTDNLVWKLWLDDLCRDPNSPERNTPEGFLGAASTVEAIALVEENGLPGMISFDHDLGVAPDGSDDNAMEFLKWLAYTYEASGPNLNVLLCNYKVHSANPVGKANIVSFMESWRKSLSMG